MKNVEDLSSGAESRKALAKIVSDAAKITASCAANIGASTNSFFPGKDFHKDNKNIVINTGIYRLLCIGASTGGPAAVEALLRGLGKNFPLPVLYVQHVGTGSDGNMAKWFSEVCPDIGFVLARTGMIAKPGTVYMAPAGRHMVVSSIMPDGFPVLTLTDEPHEQYVKPCVNKLFRSAAGFFGKSLLAVLMTGMGRDGADGCKVIMEHGGHTIVEDESTCAVFGMPQAAIQEGGAGEILPGNMIAGRILELIR